MRVYLQFPIDRQESRELLEKIADKISKKYELINPDFETDLYKAEQADALVVRIDGCDDSTWAVLGMARAGNRPVIPFWNAGYPYPDAHSDIPQRVYGFTRDFHLRNRPFVRTKKDEKIWPSTTPKDVYEDLKILGQKKEWRRKRIKKPDKNYVNLNLPLYIVGDSRNLEHAMIFYWIKNQFLECGIESRIPPEELDNNYDIDKYPMLIDMSAGSVDDCFDLASNGSSFVVSRADTKNLIGARWEEGVAWFHSKPILYLYLYLFPPRNPGDKYRQHQNPGMHLASVFKQNEELWGIQNHVGITPSQLAGEIVRARNLDKTNKNE